MKAYGFYPLAWLSSSQHLPTGRCIRLSVLPCSTGRRGPRHGWRTSPSGVQSSYLPPCRAFCHEPPVGADGKSRASSARSVAAVAWGTQAEAQQREHSILHTASSHQTGCSDVDSGVRESRFWRLRANMEMVHSVRRPCSWTVRSWSLAAPGYLRPPPRRLSWSPTA